MIISIIDIIVIFLFISCSDGILKPPSAPKTMVTDTYHGQHIDDPYRNLENINDSIVVKWLKEQGNFAFRVLKSIPGRRFLMEQQEVFERKSPYHVSGTKITSSGMYFYVKTMAEENVGKLYYRSALNAQEILLYDPLTFKPKSGTTYRINYIKPDGNGEKIAISLAKQGEEISQIIVMDVRTKKILLGIIGNAAPSAIGGIQWLPDNSGFLYSYLPVVDPNNKDFWLDTASVYYKIGSDPENLKEVFSKSNNPELNLKSEDFPLVYIYSDSDNYVFGKVSGSSPFKAMYYKHKDDILSNTGHWKLLYDQQDKVEKIMMDNDTIIFLSAKNAPNYQIGKTSITNPDFENPEIVIAEKEDRIISDFEITKDGLFFVTVKNGVDAKLYHYRNGIEKEITLPNPSGKILINSKGANYKHLWVAGSGWINASITYKYDIKQNKFKRLNLNPVTEYDEFVDLVVEEIEIPSHDGAMVPLSIIHKKGIKKNGKNPVLFYGYGSYGTSVAPFFSPVFLTWVTEGGVLAIAHVRGGGEKGDTWRKAGYKTTKPNTWKDLIACTEYMIDQGYTSSEKTAVWGTSAGGIMAGRAMTDRPDLYKAVILYSPAMNMLRSEVQPNGLNSIKEFGTVEKPDEFRALLEMDSYQHIKEGIKYPATLVAAGTKDSRVVVWDPAKFAARLQAANVSKNPILFAVDFDSGHGAIGNTKLKRHEQYANAFAFAFWQTGHPDYQPE